MYNIKLEAYVPKPKPARGDRIVAAHYYAAWKKGAAGLHEGFDDLAEEYPDRTPLMGYYDEENPEVCDWEIKWALEHGINCFIYCWYRRSHNMGKPITLADLRCAHGIHEALFQAKYANMMKFAIMFEASPVWCGTDEMDMIENLMPFWMENYFQRENYLVIDNKPVLFVYNPQRLLRECFQSDKTQKETFDKCREYARGFGFDGMIFAFQYGSFNATEEDFRYKMNSGYDFAFGYGSGFDALAGSEVDEQTVIDGQIREIRKRFERDSMRDIATVSCAWAPEPRTTERWISLGYHYLTRERSWWLSPEGFREVIRRTKRECEALPDGAWGKRILMIDNWNEWDEGHFVAPSHKYGFGHLQAIREELTARDNLPDYRTPFDQGFGGYNTSWRTPDFGAFCESRLSEEK